MKSQSKWRNVSNRVITQVVSANPNLSEVELRKKISDAYPFHERAYHPYKIWLSAVKLYFSPRSTMHARKPKSVNENQISMFGD
jgi:hypothetical protein